jgi:hypothetical protein
MQLDSQGLQMQQAAETARREAGKLGMKVLQQQMQVSAASHPHSVHCSCIYKCMTMLTLSSPPSNQQPATLTVQHPVSRVSMVQHPVMR